MSGSMKDLIVFRIEKADFYLLQSWLAHKLPEVPDVWTQLEKIGLEELPRYLAAIQVDHERRTVWCVASYSSGRNHPSDAQQKLHDFWASADAGVPYLVSSDEVGGLWPDSGTYTFAVASLRDDRGSGGIRVITS